MQPSVNLPGKPFAGKLFKRWVVILLLGITLGTGGAFVVSYLTRPVYQATATLLIDFENAGSSYENTTASLEAVPTYAQLLLSPAVLKPVAANHAGMMLQDLSSMLLVEPVANTQLIKLTVESNDPALAAQLADEVCQSFEHFALAKLPITVQVFPAELPLSPARPKPVANTLIGALAGVGFAVACIIIFEWIAGLTSSKLTHASSRGAGVFQNVEREPSIEIHGRTTERFVRELDTPPQATNIMPAMPTMTRGSLFKRPGF